MLTRVVVENRMASKLARFQRKYDAYRHIVRSLKTLNHSNMLDAADIATLKTNLRDSAVADHSDKPHKDVKDMKPVVGSEVLGDGPESHDVMERVLLGNLQTEG